MFNNLNDIKEFIKWCKANKIKNFKHDNVEFEISDIGLIEDITPINLDENIQEDKEKSIIENTEQDAEDEDLLFWSSDT